MRQQGIISVVITICVIGISTCLQGCKQSSEKEETKKQKQIEEYREENMPEILVQILGMYQARVASSSIDYISAVEKFVIQNGFIQLVYDEEIQEKILEENGKILQFQASYKGFEIVIITTAGSPENGVYMMVLFFNSDETLGRAAPAKFMDDVTKLAQESGVLYYNPQYSRWELLGQGWRKCEVEINYYVDGVGLEMKENCKKG